MRVDLSGSNAVLLYSLRIRYPMRHLGNAGETLDFRDYPLARSNNIIIVGIRNLNLSGPIR
jgi:hypothetical protein